MDRLEAALARIEQGKPAPVPPVGPHIDESTTRRVDALIAQLRNALAPTMP